MKMMQISFLIVWASISLHICTATVQIIGAGTVYVVEHSAVGTVITTLHANDDTDGAPTWSVNDTDFSISSSGVLKVASTGIDREALPAPHIIPVEVTATIGSDSASEVMSVVVQDINDNPPVFENTNTNSDSIELPEDQEVYSLVYTIAASDPDYGNGGNYHFLLSNPDGFFSVNYFTGAIELTQSLDHETNTLHTLTIKIRDEGVPQLTTTVTITVNVTDAPDDPPVPHLKHYYGSLAEGSYTFSSSPTLATVSASPGTAGRIVKYTIVDGGQDWIGQFNVGLTSGAVTINGDFDREAQSRYVVSIKITEYHIGGTILSDAPVAFTTLILTITDINDNAPQFYSPAYVGYVDEDADEGHIVIATVNAFDLDEGVNAEFLYEILSKPPEFQIDPITGVINVTGSFDYESLPNEYSFTILAKESAVADPKQGSASVTIYVLDVNDNAPMLSAGSYQYILTENVLKSFTPTISATDADESEKFNTLTFTINGIGTQEPYKHFNMSTLSANVTQLSTVEELDKESIDYYHMIVTVRDNGVPPLSSTADIYVNVTDLNDFYPLFTPESYSVMIDEGVTYPNCLTVYAVDGGDADLINRVIKYSLEVTSSSPNTSISGLQSLFTINQDTGVIRCDAISPSFNYETIILTATATDTGINPGPLSDTAVITVSVEPNIFKPVLNPPTYMTTIPENTTVGDSIGVTVHAVPGGSDTLTHVITYSIVGGNPHGAFAIDADTGLMTVASSLGIDYEGIDSHMISVIVEALDTVDSISSQNSATTTVTVKITDVNEFAPEFSSPLGNPSYIVSEGETVLPKTIVTAVATDDDGTNNIPTYTISTPTYGMFEIGKTTGILTMTFPPDREAITAADDSFTITITATDSDPKEPKSSSVTITIEVTDVNDHPPVFNVGNFTISPIPEDTGGAVSLLTITAVDKYDIGINAEISYKIDTVAPSKPGKTKFQLDSSTGVLQTGPDGFDYEDPTDRMYTIVMVAEDGGDVPLTDTATATITITDVNDNPPFLCEQFLEYTMDEYSGSTLSLTDITILTNLSCVTDVDSSTFKYRILDTSKTNGWFDVDSNNGYIYIPQGTNIDREHADTIIDKFGRAIFTFEVEVTDSSFSNGDYFSDEAEITVYINDINDNSPVFSVTSIDRTLPEGVPIGTIVDIVSATDNDFKTNAIITYSKHSGDPSGYFTVSSDGRISTALEIDKEMINNAITFVVVATDNDGHNDTVDVKVTITDTNDNSPIFNPSFTQNSILENEPIDKVAATVFATDADSGVNAEITYAITGGNIDNAFKIADPSKGEIKVAKALDRETVAFYRLVVVAKDGATGSFQRTAVTEVVITLIDVNDNYPIFLYQDHKASVPENIANNTFVAVSPSIYATDRDTGVNAVIVYDIESGFPFTIDSKTGFVYTSYVSVLDRENIDFYNITVYARDTGGLETSGTLSITITDINDHPPVITQSPTDLDTTISEYYIAGGLIGTVTVTDEDIGVNSVIKYSLTGGEGYFQVDPNHGNVTLSQTISNLERRTPFVVTITATDGGLPAKQDSITFDIDVTDENDNAPVFTHDDLEYSYPEDTDVSSPILLPVDPALTSSGVVTDADEGINQEYTFHLTNSSSPAFDLDSNTGSLYFTSAMDYENQTTYTGSIYVVDKGSPALTSTSEVSITLSVTDVNDLPPVLDKDVFAVNVSEYTSSNVPLLLVTATDGDTLDANKEVSFSLTGSAPASGLDLFKINSDSGLLLTNAFLDDSTKGCYLLNIEVNNPGTQLKDTGEASICITDQNESPDFDKSFYNFTINENEPANTELGFIRATDPDSDPDFTSLTYTLVTDPSDEGLFSINSTTGLLITLQPLDREDSSLHVLSVIVQDKGNDNFQHTNYTTILVNVLDLNDNNPQLDHSTFNSEYIISEDIKRNTTIATINATDVDLNTVNNFRILDDPKTLFKIDHQTGVLQTEGGPNDFDRESFANYTITFEVYNVDDVTKVDQSSITFILTDVNDNRPYFTVIPNDTCIYENSPNGLDLGTFVSDDADLGINARVFYQIIGGNTAQAFTIEALTGKLKTQNPLDYEEDPLEYTLTIEVQDLGIPPLSASTDITICVLDTNDNPPYFINEVTDPVIIAEHPKNGSLIAEFTTIDIDSHPFNITNLSLISGNEEGAFEFRVDTRQLIVHASSLLDYEHDNGTLSYTLTIEAVDVNDLTKTASSSVTVLITNINDHPPYFDKTEFNLTLLEDESVGTILEQVVASDVDTEDDYLVYTILSGNNDGKYHLNSSTGILRLADDLDYEAQPNYYYLVVNVTDGELTDQAYFHIYVENINDVAPVINNKPIGGGDLVLYIPEDRVVGSLLFAVDASDAEGDVLIFSFADEDNTAGITDDFSINSTTGEVTLTSELDYETDNHHEFTVFVRDHGVPPLQDFIHVVIHVTDVNDHLPQFNISSQTLGLYENHTLGIAHSFLTLTSTDVDVSDTAAGNFYYYIVLDNGYLLDIECGDAFCVEQETGKVYHNRQFDYEVVKSYSVTFAVSNRPTPLTNVSVEDMGLDTETFVINILDNNDNTPQFLSSLNNIAIEINTALDSLVYICRTEDADSNDYGKVWFRWTYGGDLFHLDTQSCLITLASPLVDVGNTILSLAIEAYDNEGRNPSNSNIGAFNGFIFDRSEHEVVFRINNTFVKIVQNNKELIERQLTNITNLIVVISDIKESTDSPGSVDVSFIVSDGKIILHGDRVVELVNNSAIFFPGANNTEDMKVIIIPTTEPTIPPRVGPADTIPYWVIIIIIVLMASYICILCCCLCAFCIVDKRRKRKLKEKNEEYNYTDFSAVSSKEFSAIKNPLWVSPVIVPPKIDVESLSGDESIERPNPIYEEKEIVYHFDKLSQDALSVASEEELPPPPLSTTNLMSGASSELLLPVSTNSNRPQKVISIQPLSRSASKPKPPPPSLSASKPEVPSSEYRPAPAVLKPFSGSPLAFSSDEDDGQDLPPTLPTTGPPESNVYMPAPAVLKPFSDPALAFSSSSDDDDDITDLPPPPRPSMQSTPTKKATAQPVIPPPVSDNNEFVMNFSDEYDDEEPPDSDEDGDDRADLLRDKRFSNLSRMDEDDENTYEMI